MKDLESIKKLAKSRSVLFVEDDDAVVGHMQTILNIFFDQVFIANDGQEGESLFKDLEPDLVITDINMPKQDGIAMAKKIREVSSDVPIIVSTAYSDEEHLMDSIFIGIDRYIKKPISQDDFVDALYHCLLLLHQRDQAKEYSKKKEIEKINKVALQTLKDAVNILPNPVFVFDSQEKLYYINDFASNLFTQKDISKILETSSIDDFLVSGSGRLSSLKEVSEDSMSQNKIMLRMPSSRQRVFLVYRRDVNIEGVSLCVYTLGDITKAEYALQKSNNLSKYLHEMIRGCRSYRNSSDLDVEFEEPKTKSDESFIISGERSLIDSMHHNEKIDAKSYMQQIDEEIKEDLDEISELELELKEALLQAEEGFDEKSLNAIASIFKTYAKAIGLLLDFEDVTYSLDKLSELLTQLECPLSDTQRMVLLLKAIAEDLSTWYRTIFIDQNTVDIHYLDASLLSSCLQIRADFTEEQLAVESEDLELF